MRGAGGLVTVDGRLCGGVQLRLQARHHLRELRDGGNAVRDGEAGGAGRSRVQNVLLGQHPAPGISEQMEPVQPQGAHHGIHLGHRAFHGPKAGIRWAFGVAAAELIPEDDLAVGGQPPQRPQVVVR